MVVFQKNELVVVLKNPEFLDADEYFSTVKYKKDYNYDIHAFNHEDERRILKLQFKEVPKRFVDQMREFIYTYNHVQVQFIDWMNTGNNVMIRNNKLEAKAEAIGEFFSFNLEVEII